MTPLERVESMMKTNSMMKTSSLLREDGEEVVKSDRSKDGLVNTTMGKLFGPKTQRQKKFSALDESAKKAAPKLFFAGERTFLQWMHTGILLAGISMAMGSHTETGSVVDWISLCLLPVAIGIMVYGMFQCEWSSVAYCFVAVRLREMSALDVFVSHLCFFIIQFRNERI
jgi:uncharacterized membrane protein YidH (DUF202 family)